MKWLYNRAQTHGDKLFLNELTYGTVLDLTIATAKRLAPHLRGESRIALWAENSVSMAIHLFALSALGIETVLLNTNLTEREVTEQMESTEVRTLLMSEKMTQILRAHKGVCDIEITDVSRSSHRQSTAVLQYLCFSKDIDFNPISLKHSDENLEWDPSDEKVFCIINTSATTGKFKSVPVRWSQIKAHVKASANVLGVEKDDNWLVVLPMFHVSGLSIILRTLYNGTRATIREKFSEQVVLEALKTDEVTMVSLVPTVLQRIVERIQVPTLRAILLGGEFIPMPLLQECVQRNLPVYKTYGMSETFAQSTTFSIQEYPNKLASVGYPLQGVTIEIRNPDEEGVGEVWLSSPMLMKGYLNKELIKGAFNTDDIGYVDEDGFLYLLNRRKDIIISGGENIYPKEIEDILYGMDGIQECAVIPVSDPKWGQVPVLCVVTNCSKEDISQYLLSRLAKYKVPKRMIYFDALPKNSMGKILRQDLIHTVERA
ncbi:o-succinylbenzoate--CoA ligase [Veillonella sp. DNF00869]|uniref:o-succinylbenzoate--CoA ligase n=1 Tax=Veillonella sp. DNF00869 TaxID=1384081 RepID=UPI00078271F9|nr:o-succinylbenzoate--CoA ligase [Veillonella sp. DNF00869]KXB87233.1 O-succinylbenzoate-CoA ligase [Veillonella sp. DNF00869]